MSDFINSGWALYVAGITIAGLLFCAFILIVASKRKVMASDNTTGHVWDEDLRELNNPLPRWWMWLFVITVIFSAVYLALYPGLGSMPGTLKWTSAGQWQAEQDKAHAAMAPVYAKYTKMSAADLAKDTQAMGIGERLFVNNCAQCHGSDAHGSKGFPNLTDSDWLGGTGAEYIAKTISGGRIGVMPPMALRCTRMKSINRPDTSGIHSVGLLKSSPIARGTVDRARASRNHSACSGGRRSSRKKSRKGSSSFARRTASAGTSRSCTSWSSSRSGPTRFRTISNMRGTLRA